jgi:dTDP-4-dehydrorhamnose reductase
MKRILLIGKNGQVGWELQRTLSCLGEVFAHDSDTLNLADPSMLRAVVQALHPHIIVNAGAYTAVDKAESELDLAMAVNGTGPAILAEEARRWGSILVHYSTDYIFNGEATTPYGENAPVSPLNAYGKSKWAGEQAVRDSKCKHLIFRTSWVYGNRGKNFFLTMLNLAKTKPSLSVVEDQIGAPTWSRSIAEATAQSLLQAIGAKGDELWGTYHMTCGEQTSWFGFAEAIFAAAHEKDTTFKIPELKPIPTSGYPTPAKRPAYSVMDNRKLESAFHLRLPSWKKALELCIQERTTI